MNKKDVVVKMKYFLFGTRDRGNFVRCVEDEQWWGRTNNKEAFVNLNISKGDHIIFYCSKEKSFIAVCEVLDGPQPTSKHNDLKHVTHVPVVIRLKKIKGIKVPLNEHNWSFLNTFKHLKNRDSVAGSLRSKSRREIDSLDYKYIINSNV